VHASAMVTARYMVTSMHKGFASVRAGHHALNKQSGVTTTFLKHFTESASPAGSRLDVPVLTNAAYLPPSSTWRFLARIAASWRAFIAF